MAYIIDILPIILIVLGISYYFLGFDKIWLEYIDRGDNIEPRIEFLRRRNMIRETSFLLWVVYSMFMEASNKQGSFGKHLMGIKVVDEFGNKLSVKKSILRNLSKILSYLAVFVGFLWIIFDKKKQAWHDKINKTYVVLTEENFENNTDERGQIDSKFFV